MLQFSCNMQGDLYHEFTPEEHSANQTFCKLFFSLSQRTCLLCLHLGNPETSYSIMTMQQLEELTVSQLAKKFPAIYCTRRFVTVFTRARNLCILNYFPRLNLRPFAIFLDVVVSVSPKRKLEDHPLSLTHNSLINLFSVFFHILWPSPPSAT
jgi:hypothetical protein